MHLTLFVPDLLWPDVDDAAAFDFPGSADLARFLWLGTATRSEMDLTASWESRLAAVFGFPPHEAPLSALRSLGSGNTTHGLQLCTDPVNLDFMQQAMVLSPIAPDTLSTSDIASLLQHLNEEFTGEGCFTANTGRDVCQWTFTPFTSLPAADAGALPNLAASSRLAGRRVDADETRALLGREGLRWINRIQMCLNQHPVNTAREAQGLPLINSLWPWGLGELSARPSRHFVTAYGHSDLLTGLCLATQTPQSTDTGFPQTDGSHLITELRLATAICHNDLHNWQSAITELTTHWISPALAGLTRAKPTLKSLTLISPNAHFEHQWVLEPSSRGLRPNLLQRCLGLSAKAPTLHALVRSWSV